MQAHFGALGSRELTDYQLHFEAVGGCMTASCECDMSGLVGLVDGATVNVLDSETVWTGMVTQATAGGFDAVGEWSKLEASARSSTVYHDNGYSRWAFPAVSGKTANGDNNGRVHFDIPSGAQTLYAWWRSPQAAHGGYRITLDWARTSSAHVITIQAADNVPSGGAPWTLVGTPTTITSGADLSGTADVDLPTAPTIVVKVTGDSGSDRTVTLTNVQEWYSTFYNVDGVSLDDVIPLSAYPQDGVETCGVIVQNVAVEHVSYADRIRNVLSLIDWHCGFYPRFGAVAPVFAPWPSTPARTVIEGEGVDCSRLKARALTELYSRAEVAYQSDLYGTQYAIVNDTNEAHPLVRLGITRTLTTEADTTSEATAASVGIVAMAQQGAEQSGTVTLTGHSDLRPGSVLGILRTDGSAVNGRVASVTISPSSTVVGIDQPSGAMERYLARLAHGGGKRRPGPAPQFSRKR